MSSWWTCGVFCRANRLSPQRASSTPSAINPSIQFSVNLTCAARREAEAGPCRIRDDVRHRAPVQRERDLSHPASASVQALALL